MAAVLAATSLAMGSAAIASSHREAPFVAGLPKVDGTDFYMFRSYEPGREGFVTILANYQPLQDAYGGPNYFTMDPDALYEIHVDNSGDSAEDLTFQFRFTNAYGQANIPSLNVTGGKVPVTGGPAGGVQVPLANIGPGMGAATGALNVTESYTVKLVRGNRRTGSVAAVTAASGGASSFTKPVDNIGSKSIPDYAGYAAGFVQNINVPGCAATGARMFVGQRREGFVVNLGQVFDQVNLNPLGARNSAGNTIGNKNVTTLALELPIACLTNGADPVIGAWTTASKRQARLLNPNPAGPVANGGGRGPSRDGGAWTQVSRLGSPLVNEVVIGITDKDKFNTSEPKNDVANFGAYVLYPTLPVLVNVLFNVPPPATPRNDLLAAFVTGVTATVNGAPFKYTAPTNLTVPGEMLRLNTAIAPAAIGNQNDLGFLGCDLAGFPNGRRPVDDVVDIALTVAEGALTGTNGLQTCNVSGATPMVVNPGAVVNDGARPNPAAYLTAFPYLNTPVPGSP
ncbi:DUF4331 domain-containing protein [Solimonas sp. SE-A11]|uniref:DUF4331 domain-containing protein n=1 Tax=Solimonas sp. SE-A11 TaxID=3054954 RepID=UPI00259C68CD|nr:DUF4331 domain-containing protein [Solimonas sp. SE-A11]MDM4772600.1 DUF4331 domain-containing protein [Solimonas sp. SE-A11]